jgi:DTW domain-containing protein YfiP
VLILQHPQEPREVLSSARLAHLALSHSVLKIGLSWPNLKSALGTEAAAAQWAVLYLGSGMTQDATLKSQVGSSKIVQFVTKSGRPTDSPPQLEGIVVLDGTWSQAKALWWRNPWLLKLKRMILQPALPSLYGKLRHEPRKECLSTIESIAESLSALGEPPEIKAHLKDLFQALLERHKTR